MVRKSLDYQGIARRAQGSPVTYDTDIDTGSKRRFKVIDRAVQKARQEIAKENMNCKPLHDNVLVRRAKADDVSKGGIFIPTTAQEKTTEGEVVAAGDGLRAQDGTVYPLAVKPGDRVLFEKHAAAEVKIDGEDLVVLREFNIICILNK
ncbi:MAG TPA: co-chaperone GroES [Anaerovoracaceae bacterium]|nr:co-chaperone GroES [Anaerovoracaceae bacterium]